MRKSKYSRLKGMIERRINKRVKGIKDLDGYSYELESRGGYHDVIILLKGFTSTMHGEVKVLRGMLKRSEKS